MSSLKIGPAYDRSTQLGPLVNAEHRGSVIDRIESGMVGISVGIPVPLGMFGFTGHKHSFFGDLHAMGADGVRFYSELKSVTAYWFSGEEERAGKMLNSWDGMTSMTPR